MDQYEFFKRVKLTEDGYLIVEGGSSPGEDVTININGDLYKVVTAPDTENIQVLDQNDNPVGSLVGGNWIVNIPVFTDVVITINGVAYGTFGSGDSDNILVKNTNNEVIGSLIGGEWIIPDSSITVNSVAYDDVKATGGLNVVVKNTDDELVGEKIGTEWIVPAGGGSWTGVTIEDTSSYGDFLTTTATVNFPFNFTAEVDDTVLVVVKGQGNVGLSTPTGWTLVYSDQASHSLWIFRRTVVSGTLTGIDMTPAFGNWAWQTQSFLIKNYTQLTLSTVSTSPQAVTASWGADDNTFITFNSYTGLGIVRQMSVDYKGTIGNRSHDASSSACLFCGIKRDTVAASGTPSAWTLVGSATTPKYFTIVIN
jgi:hypothetical protein